MYFFFVPSLMSLENGMKHFKWKKRRKEIIKMTNKSCKRYTQKEVEYKQVNFFFFLSSCFFFFYLCYCAARLMEYVSIKILYILNEKLVNTILWHTNTFRRRIQRIKHRMWFYTWLFHWIKYNVIDEFYLIWFLSFFVI